MRGPGISHFWHHCQDRWSRHQYWIYWGRCYCDPHFLLALTPNTSLMELLQTAVTLLVLLSLRVVLWERVSSKGWNGDTTRKALPHVRLQDPCPFRSLALLVSACASIVLGESGAKGLWHYWSSGVTPPPPPTWLSSSFPFPRPLLIRALVAATFPWTQLHRVLRLLRRRLSSTVSPVALLALSCFYFPVPRSATTPASNC